MPEVKLKYDLEHDESWIKLKKELDSVVYWIETIKAQVESSLQPALNLTKESMEKMIGANLGSQIKTLESQATNLIRESLVRKESEIDELKSRLYSLPKIPEGGYDYIKNELFVFSVREYILVAQRQHLVIDKVITGSYTKTLTKKFELDGYLILKIGSDGKPYNYSFVDSDFNNVNTFHSDNHICLGDISNEAMNIEVIPKNICKIFKSIMKTLHYINYESMYSSWHDNSELKSVWEEAKGILVEYFERHDTSKICNECGSVISTENGECVDCGHGNDNDDDDVEYDD